MALGPRTRVLLVAALVFAALAALVWYLSSAYWSQPATPLAPPRAAGEPAPPPNTATPAASAPTPDADVSPTPGEAPGQAPVPLPTSSPSSPPAPAPPSQAQLEPPAVSPSGLVIPVAGVRPEQLHDTFSDARSEGRRHDAIDIIAPRGTPVLAAADGRVVKLFNSAKGGLTIYQIGTDERTVYYYAHLDRYADGLSEGLFARRGQTLAYVGDTGNATPGNYHLHFQIYTVADPKNFWDGNDLNPYELLKR